MDPISRVCTIYFVRPGPTDDNSKIPPTEANPNGGWSHADETPLNEGGKNDAQIIGELFKNVKFNGCYASKAKRTRQTAKLILKKNLVTRPIEKSKHEALYEMRLGKTEGKDTDQIIAMFKEATGYPSPDSIERCPKTWAKRKGKELQPNDVFLDEWAEIDNFDDFSKKCNADIDKIASENLDKTLLFVPHGTPIKAMIGAALGLTSDRVKVGRGAYGVITINAEGKAVLKEKSEHITFEV